MKLVLSSPLLTQALGVFVQLDAHRPVLRAQEEKAEPVQPAVIKERISRAQHCRYRYWPGLLVSSHLSLVKVRASPHHSPYLHR